MIPYSFNTFTVPDRLRTEILASINNTIENIETWSEPQKTIIWFSSPLTAEELITLNNLIAKHVKTINDVINIEAKEKDTDGAQIVRLKAAKKGWSFWAIPIEATTSKIGGDKHCKYSDGNDIPWVSCKIYNANDEEITTPGLLDANLATCVKTVIDFEPNFDFEIIGGSLRINSNPASDIRLWIVGAPDIPVEFGGSKEFTSGINLKFLAPDSAFDIDGRVTKFLAYDPVNHTGKMRFILKHPAGSTVNLQFVVHIYRL